MKDKKNANNHSKPKKCDFCEKSDHNGKCFYQTQFCRERYCEKAIKRMMECCK